MYTSNNAYLDILRKLIGLTWTIYPTSTQNNQQNCWTYLILLRKTFRQL